MHGRFRGGVFHLPHLLVWHKILFKGLFLKGLQPGEIRLVIRIYPGHQLHIGAVLIRQVPVPGTAEIPAAPGPLLLAGRNMMIRHMQDARFFSVIIASYKIIFGFFRHI